MTGQDNSNKGPMSNYPLANQSAMPEMMQAYPNAAAKPIMENAMTYKAIYPEVYYKLKPYITMAGDILTSSGSEMPTQQQLDDMTDEVYDEFVKSNPDMADYMTRSEMPDTMTGAQQPVREVFNGFGAGFGPGFGPGFGFRRFRRRGLGRDFISALLLAELLGRGRFFFL